MELTQAAAYHLAPLPIIVEAMSRHYRATVTVIDSDSTVGKGEEFTECFTACSDEQAIAIARDLVLARDWQAIAIDGGLVEARDWPKNSLLDWTVQRGAEEWNECPAIHAERSEPRGWTSPGQPLPIIGDYIPRYYYAYVTYEDNDGRELGGWQYPSVHVAVSDDDAIDMAMECVADVTWDSDRITTYHVLRGPLVSEVSPWNGRFHFDPEFNIDWFNCDDDDDDDYEVIYSEDLESSEPICLDDDDERHESHRWRETESWSRGGNCQHVDSVYRCSRCGLWQVEDGNCSTGRHTVTYSWDEPEI